MFFFFNIIIIIIFNINFFITITFLFFNSFQNSFLFFLKLFLLLIIIINLQRRQFILQFISFLLLIKTSIIILHTPKITITNIFTIHRTFIINISLFIIRLWQFITQKQQILRNSNRFQ